MEQKKYKDIAVAKEADNFYVKANIMGFTKGDHIIIQEKVDGANASFRYDTETGKLVAFSRNHRLNYDNTLRGFGIIFNLYTRKNIKNIQIILSLANGWYSTPLNISKMHI